MNTFINNQNYKLNIARNIAAVSVMTITQLACGGPEDSLEEASFAAIARTGPTEITRTADDTILTRGSAEREIRLRLNDFGVIEKLAIEAFNKSGWNDKSWNNKTLWSGSGSCNRRTVKIVDIELKVPLSTNNLDVEVLSSRRNRIKASADITGAYATATFQYKRTRHNNLCFWWSSGQTSKAVGIVEGVDFSLDADIDVTSTKPRITRLNDIDLEFGEIDIDLGSTRLIADWLLEALERLLGLVDIEGIVNHYVEEASNKATVKNKLKDAVNSALGLSLEVEQSASINGYRASVNAEISNFATTTDPTMTAEIGYEFSLHSSDACAQDLTYSLEPVIATSRTVSHDFEVRIPRHAVGEALYILAKTGVLCQTVPLGASSYDIIPSGRITTSRGSVVDGFQSVKIKVPMGLVDNGSQTGSFDIEIELYIQLDAAGNLVVTNFSAPQVSNVSGSVRFNTTSISLSTFTSAIQSAVNTAFPTGALTYQLMPSMVPLGGSSYNLSLKDVLVTTGGMVHVWLDMVSGSASSGGSGGGTGGGTGGYTPGGPGRLPPIDVPLLDFDTPDYADDEGDLGSNPAKGSAAPSSTL